MTDAELFTLIKDKKDWKKIKTKKHELNYFIMLDGTDLYLLFQESDGKKDWKDNLNFIPFPCKVYKNQENKLLCHRGFMKEYKSGNDEIMAELIVAIHQHTPKRVIVSGWSNGGAMALLATEDIHYRTGIKPILITFGSPKVAYNKETVKTFENACLSITEWCHVCDIVTDVPFGGKHVRRVDIGEKKPFGKLNPWKYHTNYDKYLTN